MRCAMFFAAGCGAGVPLSEVPIRGGTEAQQYEVRAALVEFDAAVGAGRVEVRSVHIRRFADRRTDEELTSFRDSVWHELCHALEDDEGITLGEPLIARLREGLFDPAYPRTPLLSGTGR